MKCNMRELAHMSDLPCIIEGRLNYKKISSSGYRGQNVFKERWFRLINNYLFYYKISEMGKFDTKNPAGVFVMENSSIEMEHGQSIPFAFTISFIDESDKRHLFAARSEDNVVQWVMKLRTSSYEYLRSQLHTLQSKIYSITGKDPLLLVPRNDGAKLWEPTAPQACRQPNSSFNCHLHPNGAFALERSKSDIQARKHLIKTHSKPTFYTDEDANKNTNISTGFSLERSKTTVMCNNQLSTLNNSIFDNRPMYSRTAPSPPIRKKLSPSSRRTEMPEQKFNDVGIFSAQSSILDPIPVTPPRRKISPRTLEIPAVESDGILKNNDVDLIKF